MVTPNDNLDADVGNNQQQNYPVLVSRSGNTIYGHLKSAPNQTYTIQFYWNQNCDDSGFGEGQLYLGYRNGLTTDGTGLVIFNFTCGAIPAGGTGGGPPQSAPPLPFGPTTGRVTFRTVVQDRYEVDFQPPTFSGDPALNQGDPISNSVTISGDLLNVTDLTPNANSETDTSSEQLQASHAAQGVGGKRGGNRGLGHRAPRVRARSIASDPAGKLRL